MRNFPAYSEDIARVQTDRSIEIPDLRWIVPCLGWNVRLTIEESTFKRITTSFPWLQRDSMIGNNVAGEAGEAEAPPIVHLLYSWKRSVEDETHTFGHFDAVGPRTAEGQSPYYLPSNVPCKHCLECHPSSMLLLSRGPWQNEAAVPIASAELQLLLPDCRARVPSMSSVCVCVCDIAPMLPVSSCCICKVPGIAFSTTHTYIYMYTSRLPATGEW